MKYNCSNSKKEKLKDVVKPVVNKFSLLFNQKLLVSLTNQNLFLPFYHTISDKRLPWISNLYDIRSVKLFKEDLNYLVKHFKPISADDLVLSAAGKKKITEPSFHLSFDDGHTEMYDVVAPILLDMAIPATFFINSGFLDNKDLFYRNKISLIIEEIKNQKLTENLFNEVKLIISKGDLNHQQLICYLLSIDYNNKGIIDEIANVLDIDFKEVLAKHKPYMSGEQIKELADKGFSIGAHSIDHPLFSIIDYNEQIKQISESIERIDNLVDPKNKLFAFPFSDEGISKKFFDQTLSGDHKLADLTFGISGFTQDYHPNHIQRYTFEPTLIKAEELVKTQYLILILKKILGKNKMYRN